MKSYVKTYSKILFCLTLFCCCNLNAFAFIECDGKINVYEWDECEQTVLFDDFNVSGSCYHSVCVKHKYIEEDRRVYLGVLMENHNNSLDKVPENTSNEIYISFNNSSEIIVRSDLTSDYNEGEFSLKFGYFPDSFGGCNYELDCVLKELEYDEILTMNIRIKDYEGNVTQTYEVNIKSEEMKEEESVSLEEAEKESEKESKKKAEKITKRKTTKKYSSKTTKAKTTKKAETTTEYVTAILTEEYETYSETLKKNNNSILIIGVACVLTSVAAMCVALFKKENK